MIINTTQAPIISSWQPRLWLLLLVSLLSACGSSPKIAEPVDPFYVSPTAKKDPLLTKLYQQHEKWHGTPYRIGGNSRSGIDCSGFVQITYRDVLGIDLPRTTTQQFRSGPHVNRSDLQTGDLVFFRHGRHVGIYLENHRFLHASTSRGVMISDIRNHYWTQHYWRAISVLPQNQPRR